MCLGPEWATVVGTLGGVAIGGVVTHVVEGARFRRERATRVSDLRREKLEELYQAIEHQRGAVAALMVGALSIAGGLPPPAESKKYDISKLTMLVGIYLPEAQSALDATMSALGEHGSKMLELLKNPKSVPALTAAQAAASTFQQAAIALQKLVAEAARKTV